MGPRAGSDHHAYSAPETKSAIIAAASSCTAGMACE